jgi:hypothetical protein
VEEVIDTSFHILFPNYLSVLQQFGSLRTLKLFVGKTVTDNLQLGR